MRLRCVLASLLASRVLACHHPAAPPAAPARHAAIHGSIHDENDGNRIVGALVIVYCSCLTRPRETFSDAHGRYGFVELPPGNYSIQVLYEAASVHKSVDLAHAEHLRVPITINPDGPPPDNGIRLSAR